MSELTRSLMVGSGQHRPYRTMKAQRDHHQEQIFVAEGEKVVRRLLESRLEVVSLLLPEKWFPTYQPILESRPERIDLFIAEKKTLEQLTGYSMYQGVLAVGKIPPPRPLELIKVEPGKPHFLAAIEGISSAENVGVIVRSCAAFGADGLIIGETSSSPWLRRAVRSSMGTVFQLPVFEPDSLSDSLRHLRKMGVRIIAADPHTEKLVLMNAPLTSSCCILFGSEGTGLSGEILELCDDRVSIPMAPGVDSLNVGNAAAVFLYEAARQRSPKG